MDSIIVIYFSLRAETRLVQEQNVRFRIHQETHTKVQHGGVKDVSGLTSRLGVGMEDGRDFVAGFEGDNSRHNYKGPDPDTDPWQKLGEEGKGLAYCGRRFRGVDFDDELGHSGR
jgi:hypothetical protein